MYIELASLTRDENPEIRSAAKDLSDEIHGNIGFSVNQLANQEYSWFKRK